MVALLLQVMKLLSGTVKVKAKNLAGKTAMDILQTHLSPRFPRASRFLRNAKDKLLFGPTMNLVGYFREKPSFIEKQNKLLGLNHLFQTSHRSYNSNDSRSAILVVAILIVTATYQTGLSPPGGYWQENSPESTQDNDNDNVVHEAGQMTMSFNKALSFFIINEIAFFSSLYVIMNLIIGLPMWIVLYGSTVALGFANYASFSHILPNPNSPFGEIALSLLSFAYPMIIGFILFPPFLEFFINRRRRNRVDFPARYFTSSQGHS